MTKVPVAPANKSLPFPSSLTRQSNRPALAGALVSNYIGAAVPIDGMTTDEAPRTGADTGCSVATDDPHNKMEHK